MARNTIPEKKTKVATPKPAKRRIRNWVGIIYTLVSAAIIIGGTYFAIRWAQGDFRIDQNADLLARETGLLHATSVPKGAQVYIDGKLTSVTDNTIYLAPGEYEVVISMDGYSSWRKIIRIEKALVSQTNATLFPYSPSLTSITFTGIKDPIASPDGNKILFYVDTASARNKNGLYVIDIGSNNRNPRQICDDDTDYDLAHAQFLWSPDSSEILVVSDNKTFLLNTNNFVNLQSSPDISLQLKTTLLTWEEELAIREKLYSEKIPPVALSTILANSKDIFLSPDNTKVYYTATGEATIADNLIPSLPAPNSQPEVRNITPGNMYIYDSYEDKNYFLGAAIATDSAKVLLTQPNTIANNLFNAATPTIHNTLQADTTATTINNFRRYYGDHTTQYWKWMPDSTHLAGIVDNQIVIITYDGANPTTIYSGPFVDNYVLPYPDNNSILVLTTFNPDSPHNLYAIELKK